MEFVNTMNRVRNLLGYMPEPCVADVLVASGMTPEDAFLAIAAAKILEK